MSTVEKDRAPPSKTVFILGAGASAEVELPVGEALTKPITDLVDIRFDRGNWISGDPLIVDALQNHVRKTSPSNPDINPYLHAGWRIRDAMPLAASIDNFLDGHREDKHDGAMEPPIAFQTVTPARSLARFQTSPVSMTTR